MTTASQSVKFHKGDRVEPSGEGRTRLWYGFVGTVIKVTKKYVTVVWDGVSLVDELTIEEVKHVKESAQ